MAITTDIHIHGHSDCRNDLVCLSKWRGGFIFVSIGKNVCFPENIGVLINSPGFMELYSGLKNLQYLAGIRSVIGDQEIRAAMKMVGLDSENQTKVEPQNILVLNETFNALDYKTYNDMKEIIRILQAEVKTTLVT